jgi:hypothetical protein
MPIYNEFLDVFMFSMLHVVYMYTLLTPFKNWTILKMNSGRVPIGGESKNDNNILIEHGPSSLHNFLVFTFF